MPGYLKHKLAAAALALALSAPAAAQTTPGAPPTPPTPPVRPKQPVTPPPAMPAKIRCTFGRVWNCREAGCLLSRDRPVTVEVDTRTNTACEMRGNRCVARLTMQAHPGRRGYMGFVPKQAIIFRIDRNLLASAARLRGRRVFVVYGRCRSVPAAR